MGLFSRKPKSSDWKSGGQTSDGLPMAYDKNGNVRTFSADGEIITYNNKGVVISRTGGSNDNSGPGSSDDRAASSQSAVSSSPKIDQIKAHEQRMNANATPISTGGYSNSTLASTTQDSTSLSATKPKVKVEFKTAANGDLLQRAEGGNWYVAKDNPYPGSGPTSSSEGLNKKYGLGEYAKPTDGDALASRSEAMNKQHQLGEYASPTSTEALASRSDALNKRYGLGEPAVEQPPPGEQSFGHGGPINGVDTTIPPGYTATENSAPVLAPTAQELVAGYGLSNSPNEPRPTSSESTPSAPAPQQTASAPAPEEVEYTNLTRQWVSQHNNEAQNVTESPSAPPPQIENSVANQYSGEVDMAQIERDLASIDVEPAPFTLPGTSEPDLSGTGGFDASEAVPPANRMNSPGGGRHFAE